jgi:hypothetical protein
VRERGPFRRVLHQRKAEEVEDRWVVPELRGFFWGDELLKRKRRRHEGCYNIREQTPFVDRFSICIVSPLGSSESKPRRETHLEEKEAFSPEPQVNGIFCGPNFVSVEGL